jgi:phytoene dehydrogenase-like protein
LKDKSIIIIGAGLAGLSTGCYARMNGYSTRIFERHTLPGGLCTAWERKGYTIDGCIHWLMACKPGDSFRQIYDELGAFEGNRLFTLDKFVHCRDEAGGRSLAVTADLDRLAADMKALSPEDAGVIDELVEGSRALKGFDTGIPKPREMWGKLDGFKQMWQIRGLLKYVLRYNMTVESFASRIKDQFLRRCVTNLFVPEMPMYFLFVVLGQLAGGQLGLVEGGSLKFSQAIARRYQALGGEVSYGAGVEKILVENDRAVGVRLADGSEHRADLVVSAADGYSTIFHMLEGSYVDQEIRDRFANWPLFEPVMLVNFGVSRQFPDEPASNLIWLREPLSMGGQKAEAIMLRIFNYDATLAPPGRTALQVMFEADYDYWYNLRGDHDRYEAEKSKVAAEILSRLEAHYPGLAAQVEMTDVATPYTFWRYTRNYRGSYEGWLMTKEAVMAHVPKTLPGLSNFYMAGQWVEPGGGIPPALYSGRNLVQILCKRDGKSFKAL